MRFYSIFMFISGFICYNGYMADFVLIRKSRNIASSMVHILMNLLLGVSVVLITVLSGSPLIGLLMILISKWRIFAVRSRFLWLNIKSNLVDLIVGVSVVLLAYSAGMNFLLIDFILMAFYPIWLIVIKPLSSESATLAQSLIAVFLGVSALTLLSSSLNSLVLVLGSFLIGYAASRHVLSQSTTKDFTFSTLICGMVFSEIAWLSYSWNIVYSFGTTGIKIPQLALILTIFAFIYNYTRQAMVTYQDDFRLKHIIGPMLFGIVLIGVIVLWFSNPIFNI